MTMVSNLVRQASELVALHIEELEKRLKEQNEKRLVAEGRLEELELAARGLRSSQKEYMLNRGNDEIGKAVAEAAEYLDAVLDRK